MAIKERFFSRSISSKLIVIGILILIFLPASLMVRGLIEERSERQTETVNEVSSKWGGRQLIAGPVLAVPYTYNHYNTEYAYFLPSDLNINGNVTSEIRSRGIYDVPLYEGALTFTGAFEKPSFDGLGANEVKVYWDQAFVAIGIPDMRGITEQITMLWSDKEKTLSSGVKSNLFYSGVSTLVPIDLESSDGYDFSFTLNLRGSQDLFFMPLGKETTVNLSSDWAYPSFDGAFLPVDHTITESGFEANWSVLDLNRNFPQKWASGKDTYYLDSGYGKGGYEYSENAFGVKFYLPVDVYQKSTRSAKYAIAVISLVFLVVFLVEIISKRRIHPLQYLLIGLALCIFYTLLLSLAEYIRFGYAYLLASLSIIVMVTLFSKSVMKSGSMGLLNGGILAILYGFIYILLQLQDFALLIGSIGIFIILAVVMYVSRSIDWYRGQVES